MAMVAAAHAELCRLRRNIARIEGRLPESDRLQSLAQAPEAALRARHPRRRFFARASGAAG